MLHLTETDADLTLRTPDNSDTHPLLPIRPLTLMEGRAVHDHLRNDQWDYYLPRTSYPPAS